jgi:molybdate/tungstate transport system substrate-binding protein
MTYKIRFISSVFLVLIAVSCSSSGGKGTSEDSVITVFHAGSLAVPMKNLADAFRKENPGVEIRLEAAGSLACVRKITELRQSCDLLALADYDLIDQMIIPEFSGWNILFATNELCLVYTEKSLRAEQLTSSNWFEILSDPAVRYGRSDPDADPCGYRTVLALKLAGMASRDSLRWQSLLLKDTRFIRAKETDLNALLESHTIDYMFNYRSVAVQHGFKYLLLPDSASLGNPALADWYAGAEISVRGATPGTVAIRRGGAIIYGLTIPDKALNPALARKFVRFITDPSKGRLLIEQSGQTAIKPVYSQKSTVDPGLL